MQECQQVGLLADRSAAPMQSGARDELLDAWLNSSLFGYDLLSCECSSARFCQRSAVQLRLDPFPATCGAASTPSTAGALASSRHPPFCWRRAVAPGILIWRGHLSMCGDPQSHGPSFKQIFCLSCTKCKSDIQSLRVCGCSRFQPNSVESSFFLQQAVLCCFSSFRSSVILEFVC